MPTTRPRTQWTVQSLDDVSRFLRSGVADEESRQLRDGVAQLAQSIDEALRTRRAVRPGAERAGAPEITRLALALGHCVREHLYLLTSLGSAWHALYELGAYQTALRSLARAIEAWHGALAQGHPRESAAFNRVEVLAWRTLGEGLLLIEMYEHGDGLHSEPAEPAPRRGPWQRALRWLRGGRG